MAKPGKEGVRCGDRYMTGMTVSTMGAALYLFMSVMSGMARHANAGYGFTRQGSRGANSGGHRGC